LVTISIGAKKKLRNSEKNGVRGEFGRSCFGTSKGTISRVLGNLGSD